MPHVSGFSCSAECILIPWPQVKRVAVNFFFFFTSGLLPWKKHKSSDEPGRTVAEGGGGCEREKAGCHRRREKAAGSRAIMLHCFRLEEISTRLASKQT